MNPPWLLRPLRPFLQGQLSRAAVRSQTAVSRASTQLRRNGTQASEPPAAAVSKTPTAAAPETPIAAPAAPQPAAAAPTTPAAPKDTPTEAPKTNPITPEVISPEALKKAAPEAPAASQPPKAVAPKSETVTPEAPKQAVPEASAGAASPQILKVAPGAPKAAAHEATKTSTPEAVASEQPKAAAAPPAVKPTQEKTPRIIEKIEKDDLPAGTLDLSRMPRALEALYLQPLRRVAEYGIPTCDLQLRSYSLPNMEFFCDFALRVAYYLGLPAYGPVPLPKKIERWTVPKGHFVHKKSQENFERITLRRLIQIKDGHPETVQVWLAFLQKYAYYGIGMKANMWEFSKLDVATEMEKKLPETEELLRSKWQHVAVPKSSPVLANLEEFMAEERRKIAGGR